MIKIAILDDYQNAFEQIIDTDNYKDRFEFEIFNKDLRGRSVDKIIRKASEQFFKIQKY